MTNADCAAPRLGDVPDEATPRRSSPVAAAPRAPRLLVVSEWFSPEPARTVDLAVRAARAAEWDVRVVTGAPHYPAGVVYEGERNGFWQTVRDGVPVFHVYEYPSHSKSRFGRVLCYLSFALSSVPWVIRLGRGADVVYVHGSPVTTALGPVLLRALHGTPFVVHAQDLWPESFGEVVPRTGLWKLAFATVAAFSAGVYRRASRVVVISPGAVEKLRQRGVAAQRIRLLLNSDRQFDDAPVRRAGVGEVRRLLYAGNLGPAQNLEPLIRACAQAPDIRMTFAGEGVSKDRLVRLAEELGSTNIAFRPPVYETAFKQLVSEHDVMVISLKAAPVFEYTMPSKVQTIAASGTPMLAIGAGDLAQIIERAGCGWVVPPDAADELRSALQEIADAPTETMVERGERARSLYESSMSVQRFFGEMERILSEVSSGDFGSSGRADRSVAYRALKRILDVLIGSLGLVGSAPAQLVVAIAVKKHLGSPVIFRQMRPGKDERPFTLYKFRSMRDIDPSAGLMTNEERLTPFGRKLRAWSLDELPSFLNVVRGDMSLVGPRPLRMEYLGRYNETQRRRHEVRPGITGLAQVSGRNLSSWNERFEMDVWYVDHASLGLDFRILWRTVGSVLSRRGVTAAGGVAMSEFKGGADDDDRSG